MTETKKLFQQSLLAEASYADLRAAEELDGSFDKEKVRTALQNIGGIKEGFSVAQSVEFTSHWKVISHQPNTASGFSATLFESKDNSGQFSLAIRGTEELSLTSWSGWNDLLRTDIADAIADGVATSQVIDLFNYYQDLTAVSGQPVYHYNYQKETVDLFGNITPRTNQLGQHRVSNQQWQTGRKNLQHRRPLTGGPSGDGYEPPCTRCGWRSIYLQHPGGWSRI